MKLIINDKRYAALKSLGEKKQCFNEYLQQRKKGEKEEERQRLKRAKEACSPPCPSVATCFNCSCQSFPVILYASSSSFATLLQHRVGKDVKFKAMSGLCHDGDWLI